MKFVRFFIVLFLLHPTMNAQIVEVKAGIGRAHFTPLRKVDRHIHSDHIGGANYLLTINYETKKYRNQFIKAGLRLERYAGTLNTMSNFLGYTQNISTYMAKTILGLDITPVRLKIDPLILECGINLAVLIHHRLDGFVTSTTGGALDPSSMLSKSDIRTIYAGTHATAKYQIPVNSELYVFPAITTYIGFGNELRPNPYSLHALRTTLGIGMGKRLND